MMQNDVFIMGFSCLVIWRSFLEYSPRGGSVFIRLYHGKLGNKNYKSPT